MSSSAQQQQPPPPREVAEGCLDFLLIEMVSQLGAAAQSAGESATSRLEAVGFSVGQKLAERQTVARPPFGSTLDAMKFVCKEFWQELFRKQVDNLRTNNRGVYVLIDNRMRWLARISPSALSGRDPTKVSSDAAVYASFPCGLIRGALAAFGIDAIVSAEISTLPACQFTIKVSAPATVR